jgi:hypothetical protein
VFRMLENNGTLAERYGIMNSFLHPFFTSGKDAWQTSDAIW